MADATRGLTSMDDQDLTELLRPGPLPDEGAPRRQARIHRATRRQVAARDVGDFFLERLWKGLWALLYPLLPRPAPVELRKDP